MKTLKYLFLALSATLLMTACSGGKPESVVKNFQAALQKMDFDAAKKYCTKESASFFDVAKMMSADQLKDMKEKVKDMKTEIINAKIDGDIAVVTVKSIANGQTSEQDINLKKEDGEWKVAFSK